MKKKEATTIHYNTLPDVIATITYATNFDIPYSNPILPSTYIITSKHNKLLLYTAVAPTQL